MHKYDSGTGPGLKLDEHEQQTEKEKRLVCFQLSTPVTPGETTRATFGDFYLFVLLRGTITAREKKKVLFLVKMKRNPTVAGRCVISAKTTYK